MNKVIAVVIAAASLTIAACAGSGATGATQSGPMDERTRNALPTSATVAMQTPGGASNARTPDRTDSTVGAPSQLLADTIGLGVSVNAGVIFTLDLIKLITDLPATSCTTNSCTWGPGALALDPVSWQLVVTYDADANAYDYALSGMARSGGDGQMHAVITGQAVPSAIVHRGSGNFTVDFNEAKVLNPNVHDIGNLVVTYSNATPGKASINATFMGVNDSSHAGQADNALYAYAEDGQGGGSLQASAHNLTSNDVLNLDSRWLATGAGRSDVSVVIYDQQTGRIAATESECWASATSTNPAPFHVVYYSSSDAADLGPDSGNAADCAFTSAQQTTLSAP